MDISVDNAMFSPGRKTRPAGVVDNRSAVHAPCGRTAPTLTWALTAYPQSTAPTTTSTVVHSFN